MLFGNIPPRQVHVVPRHLQTRMAQNFLKAERVAAVADVEHGEGMPQGVRRNSDALDSSLLAVAQDYPSHLGPFQRLERAPYEELRDTHSLLRAQAGVFEQRLAGPRGEWDTPFFPSLAMTRRTPF